MRTLILYNDHEFGVPHCGCIIHDGSFDPSSTVDIEWKSQLTGWPESNEFFAVQDISDDAADDVYITDEAGSEIGKQYIQR